MADGAPGINCPSGAGPPAAMRRRSAALIFRRAPLDWGEMKGRWVSMLGAMVLIAGCGGQDKPAVAPTADATGGAGSGSTSGPTASSPLSAPVDYLGATVSAKRRAEGVADLAPLLSALQQFHAVEDRYPARLQELVEAGFLARVPEIPPGQVLAYDPASGMVRLSPAPSARR